MDEIVLYNKEFTVEGLTVDEHSYDPDIIIVTNTDDIKLESRHYQDCCESVYADFSTFDLYEDQLVGKSFTELAIRPIDEAGVLFIFKQGRYGRNTKILIPTYNRQNGYYSGELRLGVIIGEVNSEIDISRTTEYVDG